MRVDLEFVHPFVDIVKAVIGGQVKNQKNSNGALIISSGDRTECFLAGSVPYLSLDLLSMNSKYF